MKNKISKKIGGTMGPKRKSAPKPIVSNKVIARRVAKNPSVKSYNVSKKQTTSLLTPGGERKKNELSYVQHETGRAKRTMSPSVAPSKFEQKKIKAMNKYQSKVAKKDYSAKRKQERQAKRAQSMKQREVIRNIRKTGRPEAPLQNGKELKPIMIKPNMGRIIKPMAKFPDLSGDGKVTKKDILMGRGVIDKPKMQKNNQKFFDDKGNEITMLDNVDKKGISTQKSVERMFEGFKGAGGDIIGGFRRKDVTTENFSKLMKDKRFKKAAEQNPYYEGLKRAFRENRGFGKPSMINKPKMQNGKSLKEIQADIERAGKIAISTSDPNERDAALMKKKILMGERDDMIAANKKNLKTSKTNKTKPTMKKPKMTAKEKLAAAKKAKRAPGKAVRDARKGVRTENKNKRVAARATAKSARRATRAKNLKGRIENKKARVTKRVTKSRATNKLNKLNKPAIRKPKMSYKKKK